MSNQQQTTQVERLLSTMGASWFTVYKYDKKKYLDKLKACVTFRSRLNIYDRNKELHQKFIESVLRKDPKKLGKNRMGIRGEEIMRMAKELQDKQMPKIKSRLTSMKKDEKGKAISDRVLGSPKRARVDREKVTVFFAVNDGHAPYLGVALTSLVEHAGIHEYELIVLYRDLNERNRELLEQIVYRCGQKTKGSFRLRFMEIPINIADYDFAPGARPLSVETWFRLFAPSLFPEYDKMLWLDADILVRDDVAKLYATHMGDNWIAGCRWDYGIIGILEHERKQKLSKMRNYFTKTLGIRRPQEDYVNAGVLLLNLQAMREKNVQGKLLQAAQNPAMYFHDQCAINMVCHGHICYLDSMWNGLTGFKMDLLPKKYREKALYDKQHRKIIHWAGSHKPWKEPWCKAAVDWWEEARRTPYYEEILYTNIGAILQGEMNKKLKKLGKTYIELSQI